MQWVLSQRDVDAVIVGAGTPAELQTAARALADPVPSPIEDAARARILRSEEFRAFAATKRAEFGRPGTDCDRGPHGRGRAAARRQWAVELRSGAGERSAASALRALESLRSNSGHFSEVVPIAGGNIASP